MPTASYDLIVLGDDFAGLVAASLCASRGMRVLIAQTGARTESYDLESETVPVRALHLAGVHGPAYAKVTEELHFDHLFKRRLEVLDPPVQLLAPDLRLEAESDDIRFSQGLARELGDDDGWLLAADAVQDCFADLLTPDSCMPPTGFWERRELGKLAHSCHGVGSKWLGREHSDPCETLCDITSSALLGSISATAFSRAHAFATARQGICRVDGDWDAWRAIFVDKFKSHNGEIRRVQAQSLEVNWGKVTGLNSVSDEFTCQHLISSLPLHQLLALAGNKPPKRLIELVAQVQPIAFRYTLNLIIHMSGVPEGMGQLVWSLLDPQRLATGGNFASFSIRPASRAGRALVTMECLAPATDSGEPDLRGVRDTLLKHAREVMPFLDTHLEAVDSPHEESDGKCKRGLASPIAPSPIWECPQDDSLRMPSLPYSVGLKHLYVASEQTLPELGLEGQVIAGWSAAKLATANMGKRKSAAKPTVLAESRG